MTSIFCNLLLKITASCSGENLGVGCGGPCDSYQAIEREKIALVKTITGLGSVILGLKRSLRLHSLQKKQNKQRHDGLCIEQLIWSSKGRKYLAVLMVGWGASVLKGSFIQL